MHGAMLFRVPSQGIGTDLLAQSSAPPELCCVPLPDQDYMYPAISEVNSYSLCYTPESYEGASFIGY